jgi:release factor glutamine methyltransferase
MITVRDLLLEGKQRLEKAAAARLEAEILLSRAMGVSRSHLFAHPEQAVSRQAEHEFRTTLERRYRGEPVAYITGEREFWSLPLKITPAVLIPRPQTEVLVEAALSRIPADATWRIADIGTGSGAIGSGAIAIALAHERSDCEIHATDISADSLDIARKNASQLELKNIRFHHGSWMEPLEGTFELIASNPPYVASGDPHLREGDLRFEPEGALISGPDGLDAIRAISTSARNRMQSGGWLMIEHGHDQATACQTLFRSAGYKSIETLRDLEGTNRVTTGMLK